jgi:hypothetical protein
LSPDVAWRPPNPLEDPDAWHGDGIVRMAPGETSIRAAKARLYGRPRPRLEPDRERVRCEGDQLTGASCWREAHEDFEDIDGVPWSLCPEHGAELRAVVREMLAEEASEELRAPGRWRTCGVDGCTRWAHECTDHETPDKVEFVRAQRHAWIAERGITTPREEMPSRQDRSKEYAARNERRRRERVNASVGPAKLNGEP